MLFSETRRPIQLEFHNLAPAWGFEQYAKAQTSLRIRAVWSEPLLVAWIFYEY